MKKYIRNLNIRRDIRNALLGVASAPLVVGGVITNTHATEPCNDDENFGECKVLIEINASDGDIGFHWLADGDGLKSTTIRDPNGKLVYKNRGFGPLRKQKLTETFGESEEPVCREDLKEDEDDTVLTLEEFLERWEDGFYRFIGRTNDGTLHGETELTYELPAAPANVGFTGSVISWEAGDDLGECASFKELEHLVTDGVLPVHPENVEVDAWEVVLEPDVPDGDPVSDEIFTIRVAGDIETKEGVTVPQEYLESLPENTPVKVEVGAIGGEDNATFTEEVGFCVNEKEEGCEEED